VLTVGSCEQHADHLPVDTDTLSAYRVAMLAADRCGSLSWRGSNPGNTQNEKSSYYRSSIDFRCYLELAFFEPRRRSLATSRDPGAHQKPDPHETQTPR